MPTLYPIGYTLSTPLVFPAFSVVFRIQPPDEVLPVDPDARQAALGDEPVDVRSRHASQFRSGPHADVFVRVDLLCHAASVADRIPGANRSPARLSPVGVASLAVDRRPIGCGVDLFDGTAGKQLRQHFRRHAVGTKLVVDR